MNKHIIISLFIFFTCVSSCKNDDSLINNSGQVQIVPLKVGNQWVYENTYFDSLGNQVLLLVDTVTIAKDTIIAGEQWFKLVGSVGYSFEVTNRANGYHFYFGAPVLQYKYPATLNERYQTFVATPNDTMVVSSLSATTTVLAGTFSAYRYDRYIPSRSTIRQSSWVEPSRGIIREELYGSNNEVLSVAQLKSISLR